MQQERPVNLDQHRNHNKYSNKSKGVSRVSKFRIKISGRAKVPIFGTLSAEPSSLVGRTCMVSIEILRMSAHMYANFPQFKRIPPH